MDAPSILHDTFASIVVSVPAKIDVGLLTNLLSFVLLILCWGLWFLIKFALYLLIVTAKKMMIERSNLLFFIRPNGFCLIFWLDSYFLGCAKTILLLMLVHDL